MPKIKDQLDKIYINEMRSYLNAIEVEMELLREKAELLDKAKEKARKLVRKLKEYDQVNGLNIKEVVEVERVISEIQEVEDYEYLKRAGVKENVKSKKSKDN
ncbi:MAG: hypothetical protein AWU54_425 [Candidatus Frackibacter sp. T328-2]|nr:MAG: hypothetical protein AWU54_425 [Candidatus Frackibacter sp. T328-2]